MVTVVGLVCVGSIVRSRWVLRIACSAAVDHFRGAEKELLMCGCTANFVYNGCCA